MPIALLIVGDSTSSCGSSVRLSGVVAGGAGVAVFALMVVFAIRVRPRQQLGKVNPAREFHADGFGGYRAGDRRCVVVDLLMPAADVGLPHG